MVLVITKQQWDKHEEHMNDHITWPASKAQIIEACEGEDVEAEVMKALEGIPDREYKSPSDLMSILVKE